MNIKEIEERSGLTRANIRYYEQEGLLAPVRRENKYRDYSEEDLETLLRIALLRSLGFSLEEIRRLQSGEADFAAAIAPDIQSQHAALTGGELVLEVRSGYLRSIRVTCMGTVRVAMLEADASLGAEIALVQRNYPFPQKVLTALQ